MVFALNLYCFVILTYFAVFGFVTNSRVGRLLFLALAYKYCCILFTLKLNVALNWISFSPFILTTLLLMFFCLTFSLRCGFD